ncbi:pentatricopeptide repeat-containing protein [Pyrus ussuriensis x Pyrus communis]|uniref:Pentatricopeptide repeat-containing protein n=1 Tax=Pyrus ussuriensis x Pyrus communis TaxID=2448454 RepID=A0A5N5FAZ3_9ROSA|nr:pentatricopeptide repeat-containing protein [Pyrus ussuriensis x Pyrus communis]
MGENVAAIMKSGAGNAKVSWKGKGMHGKVCGNACECCFGAGNACECMFWCWKCKRELERQGNARQGLGKLVESWKWDGLCTALSLFGCMCM